MLERGKELLVQIRSMRVQLFAVLVVIGLIPVIFFSNILINSYEKRLISQRTDEIQSYGTVLSNLVNSSEYLTGQEAPEVEQEAESIATIYQGRVLIINQDLSVVTDTFNLEVGKTMISSEVVRCFVDHEKRYVNDLGDYVQLTMPIVNASTEQTTGAIILTFSTKNFRTTANVINRRSIILILTIAIVIMFLAFGYSVLITRPLQRVTESIDDIAAGDMDTKLDVHTYSEVERISESFNRMIDVIRQQDEAKQNFASNVSHELKTPLASMKVLSDSLLSQEGMPEELYREFLVDITHEIERMTNIINDLLTMVKLDKNTAEMNIVNISINDLIEQLLKRLRPIAAERNIELIYESFRPIMADVDEVKLSIALNNLIENAIKYNYDDGWVRVTLNAIKYMDKKKGIIQIRVKDVGDFIQIEIEDNGKGIAAKDLTNIFDRFYRVDKARSRDTGGTGLGLSLTRSTVLLHRGSIKLHSKEKEGSTFTVRIPLTYVV